MTKRVANFNESNNKKFKIADDLNDLWGEDLDIGDVDDCFMLATQVCSQENISCTQRNNVSILQPHEEWRKDEKGESFNGSQRQDMSILPSYSSFKRNEKLLFTSTQSLPSTSTFKTPLTNGVRKSAPSSKYNPETKSKYFHNEQNSIYELQIKIQKLQEQFEAKEGEASILRSQLKQIKASTEAEHSKREQVWTEKSNLAQKEMNAAKTELEFKNLEIANLKIKIMEVKKHFNAETAFNSTQVGDKAPERCKSETFKDPYKIEAVLEYGYPLSVAISSTIFNVPRPEPYQMNVKYNEGFKSNRYLQKEDHAVITQFKKMHELSNFKLDCIYADISVLMKCSSLEIDSKKCYTCINRIYFVSRHILQYFYDYLVILESTVQNDDIGQLDVLYLERKVKFVDVDSSIFDSKEWCDDEIGIKPRQTVAVLAEILPYSRYLREHLLENKPLMLKDEDLSIRSNNERNEFYFLHLLLSVINIIGKIRKADNCVGFLCAVSVLLTKICLASKMSNCCFLVVNIAKEVVFSRPSSEVIKYLSSFFKEASLHKRFVQDLCVMPAQRSLRVNSKEGTLSFNRDAPTEKLKSNRDLDSAILDSCVLQVFTVLYEDSFINKDNSGHLDVNLNMLQFITNLLNSNCLWMHYQENNHCDCVCKINNLSIEIIYETLKVYKKGSSRKFNRLCNIEKCKETLRYSVKVLYILNFKSSDLILKYSTIESQYKFIVKSLLDLHEELNLAESHLEALENLNMQDDMPTVENDVFDKIPLWS